MGIWVKKNSQTCIKKGDICYDSLLKVTGEAFYKVKKKWQKEKSECFT